MVFMILFTLFPLFVIKKLQTKNLANITAFIKQTEIQHGILFSIEMTKDLLCNT